MLARFLVRSQTETRVRYGARCLLLSAGGAALTALGARLVIPWWPVPATLQVFFVLLCGATLGPVWGAVAQAEYVAAGALGLPAFAAGRGGLAVVLGPTGGYLVGFIAAACVTGWAARRSQRVWATYAGALGGAALIWLFGWAWLARWLALGGEAAPLHAALASGVLPFVPLDVAKALAAAAAARRLPRAINDEGTRTHDV